MEPTVDGDQIAPTQSDTFISHATTTPTDANSVNENGAVLQIASNLNWLVSTVKAAQTSVKPAGTTENTPLSTADLVKILEILLTEIRANQTFAFSVLGFVAISGSVLQKTHFGGATPHNDYCFVFWGIATGFCVIGAIWTAVSKQYLSPLGAFVNASSPGKTELVLIDLRTALHKANTAVRRARIPKILVACGIGILLFALCWEFWSSTKNVQDSSPDTPKAEQQTKGR
jgi:hypothetical protein